LPYENYTVGQTLVLDKLYYDFDEWDIRPDAATELDKVVRMLKKNPTMKLELSSHTDFRGDDDYNHKLSQKRAVSAVNYVIKRGIARNRIRARGYGETKPSVKCTDCTEMQHQQNRRTEITILSL